ncbi:chemotaxis protein CheD [Roseivivax isoporae LMG 25204]|uniref:Probable chemoreceptor glutamine deamidase CheD n=1 Tax=Roseivivax isoporae LMG 25204 TaxID=1449351 RepID=X7FF23_9RHOB|nr:chemotaxis protein CheD [Roseivivax isoporae LMG 25204]
MVQGEYEVTDDPGVVLSTLLGSCVATCLCDPVARVGGMNHFLLAEGDGSGRFDERYGTYAMEVLINALLKRGARKSRLEAKLFGGAAMAGRMARIGESNCAFALNFLETEAIRLVSSSLGGERARRIRYVPTTGHARLLFVRDELPPLSAAPAGAPQGDVTLF